jgi:hypothetical protein
MREGVRITTTKKADARCVSEALADYGSELERAGNGWAVHRPPPTPPELSAVLTALKRCLDENAITFVTVTVDGQAYAMEGRET